MHSFRRYVPSANYLLTFESAARHLNFTSAGRELGISQPAVSNTVRALEEHLGIQLFTRKNNQLSLTPNGATLYKETKQAFDSLANTIAGMTEHSVPHNVRVSFSTSFVSLCVLPKLRAFKNLYPQVALEIDEGATDDGDPQTFDFDISSRLGHGEWEGFRAFLLAEESVFPVCTPEFLEQRGGISSLQGLSEAPLLHADEKHRHRIGWQEWFESAGFFGNILSPDLAFTDYHSAISAALRGQGISLGWEHLVASHIRNGELVQAFNHVYRSGLGIYLVSKDTQSLKPHAELFLNWLRNEVVADMEAAKIIHS